ncbi:MAG: FAD-dependent oxidoreductase [Mesorhizobium sp.]|nr:MAG: FAD-dependent oxidoreductase [Mesorhizobium sp.]
MEQVDCIVAGAGVIGLAIARSLAARGFGPLILEAALGSGQAMRSAFAELISSCQLVTAALAEPFRWHVLSPSLRTAECVPGCVAARRISASGCHHGSCSSPSTSPFWW